MGRFRAPHLRWGVARGPGACERDAMRHPDFERYLAARAEGLHPEAKAAMADFAADMLAPGPRRAAWVQSNLHRIETGGASRMDYVLWTRVVFPVLAEARAEGQVWGMIALARNAAGWGSSDAWSILWDMTARDFWREAHLADPENDEARRGLANAVNSGVSYAFHEWPAGLTLGADEDPREVLLELIDDVALLERLDIEGVYADAVKRYRTSLEEAGRRYL